MAISRKKVIENMEKLGVYKPEFDATIDRYVALQKEYATIYKQYSAGGYCCEVTTASGTKKSPTVSTLETLRKDILSAEESLGLTPRGLMKLRENAFAAERKSRKDDLI